MQRLGEKSRYNMYMYKYDKSEQGFESKHTERLAISYAASLCISVFLPNPVADKPVRLLEATVCINNALFAVYVVITSRD